MRVSHKQSKHPLHCTTILVPVGLPSDICQAHSNPMVLDRSGRDVLAHRCHLLIVPLYPLPAGARPLPLLPHATPSLPALCSVLAVSSVAAFVFLSGPGHDCFPVEFASLSPLFLNISFSPPRSCRLAPSLTCFPIVPPYLSIYDTKRVSLCLCDPLHPRLSWRVSAADRITFNMSPVPLAKQEREPWNPRGLQTGQLCIFRDIQFLRTERLFLIYS